VIESPATEEVLPDPAGPLPSDEDTASGVTSETPTPTAAPPVLAIDGAVAASCTLHPGEPTEIGTGGTQRYDCRADLGLTGSGIDPAQIAIDWTIDVSATGSWTVQLRSHADQPWSDPTVPPVLSAQTSIDDVVPAGDSGFQTVAPKTFELLVTRAACDMSSTTVQVNVGATPVLDGVPAGYSALPEPIRLEPALAAIGQPTVTFTGPLDFGAIGATATGPETSTLNGTLGLAISGLDTTCGTWQVSIGGSGMVDADGQPLPGSALMILPTSDAAVPCDVRSGCPVALLTSNTDTDPSQTLTLDLELRLGDAVVTGTFSTSLTVTITPADG
jgi:hypothetical protein